MFRKTDLSIYGANELTVSDRSLAEYVKEIGEVGACFIK